MRPLTEDDIYYHSSPELHDCPETSLAAQNSPYSVSPIASDNWLSGGRQNFGIDTARKLLSCQCVIAHILGGQGEAWAAAAPAIRARRRDRQDVFKMRSVNALAGVIVTMHHERVFMNTVSGRALEVVLERTLSIGNGV